MSKMALIAGVLAVLGGLAEGQTVDFELRTSAESPVVFAGSAREVAPGFPRRQFVTIRNEAKKSVAAVIFEQSVATGEKVQIVALERVGIVFSAGEKRRVSIAVADMAQKLQSGGPVGRPVLSVVAVEFLDGSQWSAPSGASNGRQ